MASLDGQPPKEVTALAERPGLVPLARREGPAQRGGGWHGGPCTEGRRLPKSTGRGPGDNAGRE